jgi:hypothetical protein
MTDRHFALDQDGLLVPPSFGAATASAPEAQIARADARVLAPSPVLAEPGRSRPADEPQRSVTQRSVTQRSVTQRPVGRLNWIYGVLAVLIGAASFVWPLVCLTVLVSLGLSAIGISRANRLRRRGANGRGIAIVGLAIGLASAANLVFGFTQFVELGSFVNSLLP